MQRVAVYFGLLLWFVGNYEELLPSNAFNFWMTPSVGHLALAFLQGSFAFSGWNFLNYVTEELVDPRRQVYICSLTGLKPSSHIRLRTPLAPPGDLKCHTGKLHQSANTKPKFWEWNQLCKAGNCAVLNFACLVCTGCVGIRNPLCVCVFYGMRK